MQNNDVIPLIESIAAKHGPGITLTTTLATYPGSTHWHFKNGDLPGVLELTWWPSRRRLWFKVAKNRDAEWITAAIEAFGISFTTQREAIEQRLNLDSP